MQLNMPLWFSGFLVSSIMYPINVFHSLVLYACIVGVKQRVFIFKYVHCSLHYFGPLREDMCQPNKHSGIRALIS
jgi:hypothetical protein